MAPDDLGVCDTSLRGFKAVALYHSLFEHFTGLTSRQEGFRAGEGPPRLALVACVLRNA